MNKDLMETIELTTSALDHVLQFARIPRLQRGFYNKILYRNRELIREWKDESRSRTGD